jgi:hypothetical protein
MKSLACYFTLLATVAINVVASVPAQAQRARVFVSVSGDDGNPCTGGSPCKTFQHAHDVVLAGGEISVLDSGGYGTLTINKALSIVAVGVQASIAIPSGGVGIAINAGSNDKVSLRGLTLDGQGVGQDGIDFNSGEALTVEDCVVRNMLNAGLNFVSAATIDETLDISNSSFFDNGLDGVVIATKSSGGIYAAIERTRLHGNSIGLNVLGNTPGGTGTLYVAVTDSVSSNNNTGFALGASAGGSPSNLSLTHTLVEGNVTGILVQGNSTAFWLAQSTVSLNKTFGFHNIGGVINSYGDNYIANALNSGALTSVSRQ